MSESDVFLDGRSITEFGLFLGPGHEHPIPETRDITLEIPQTHGLRYIDSTLGPRMFNLPIGIMPQKNKHELQRKIRQFTDFLFDDYGKPRSIRLVFGYEPDKYYIVRYSGSISPERLIVMGALEIPFIAYDPFAYFLYSANEITWDKDIPIMSDVYWGTGINQFKINENQTLEIYNSGNIVIRPTFIITGSATSLTLAMNGKSFSLPSFSNATYEIKGKNYTVFKNGVNDFNSKKGKDWLELMPGKNQLSITGTELDFYLTVDCHYKYK